MDINIVRGILLVMLILGFMGMWAWAWSKKRKPEFDFMAQLPLEEDMGVIPDTNGDEERSC